MILPEFILPRFKPIIFSFQFDKRSSGCKKEESIQPVGMLSNLIFVALFCALQLTAAIGKNIIIA